MRLYSSANSPFGARVKIAAIAKGIEFDLSPLPAGGLRSDAYLAINPIAKIPALVTARGDVIVESAVILDYLEDCFPKPPLLPSDPTARARQRMVCAVVDRYVMDPVIRLFPQLSPIGRDHHITQYEVLRWQNGMAWLEHFTAQLPPRVPGEISLVDCVLPPSLHLSTRIAAMMGLPEDPMAPHGSLLSYYAEAKANPIIGPVLKELTETQASTDAKVGLPSLAHLH